MSDAALRELERRWKVTGTLEDREAVLRARIRVGVTTPGRVELAAYVFLSTTGVVAEDVLHKARVGSLARESREVGQVRVGCPYEEVFLADAPAGAFENWSRALERRCDDQAGIRCAVAVLRWWASRAFGADHDGTDLAEKVRPVIAAAEALALDWGEEGRARVVEACRRLDDGATPAPVGPEYEQYLPESYVHGPSWWARPSFAAFLGEHGAADPQTPGWLAAVARGCVMWPAKSGSWSRGCQHRGGGMTVVPATPCSVCMAEYEDLARRAVCTEVVPWALGDGDPLEA